jgi:RP/EB family microtubule-associated protein
MARNLAATNSAYTTSRGDLLDWLNTLLGINYVKVEEASNGAAFCQILDAIFPGKVKLYKVNYNAFSEPEMISNYKILQEVFNAEKIQRNIPVETLTKGRCMAALEMLQWIKAYFDQNYSGGEYDGQGRRNQSGIRDPGDLAKKTKKSSNNATVKTSRSKPTRTIVTTPKQQGGIGAPSSQTPGRFVPSQNQNLKDQIERLKKENQHLVDERNFYYEKLQKVESLCQMRENDQFANQVLGVLYETDAERGFVSPDQLDI